MSRVVEKALVAFQEDPLLGAIRLNGQTELRIPAADRRVFIRSGAAISICSLVTVLFSVL